MLPMKSPETCRFVLFSHFILQGICIHATIFYFYYYSMHCQLRYPWRRRSHPVSFHIPELLTLQQNPRSSKDAADDTVFVAYCSCRGGWGLEAKMFTFSFCHYSHPSCYGCVQEQCLQDEQPPIAGKGLSSLLIRMNLNRLFAEWCVVLLPWTLQGEEGIRLVFDTEGCGWMWRFFIDNLTLPGSETFFWAT